MNGGYSMHRCQIQMHNVVVTRDVSQPTEPRGHPKLEKATPSAQQTRSELSANELGIFIHSRSDLLLRDTVAVMARTLACDLLASSQPPQLLGHSCFLCVYSARTIIRGGKAHCCILTNPRLGPEHSWVLCVGTNAFARPDSPVFTPLPVCSLCPTSQPDRRAAMRPAPFRIRCPLPHAHPAWPGLVLGSPHPPPALPDWPLTEPKCALLPLCHQQCQGLVWSIQIPFNYRNLAKNTKQSCKTEKKQCLL